MHWHVCKIDFAIIHTLLYALPFSAKRAAQIYIDSLLLSLLNLCLPYTYRCLEKYLYKPRLRVFLRYFCDNIENKFKLNLWFPVLHNANLQTNIMLILNICLRVKYLRDCQRCVAKIVYNVVFCFQNFLMFSKLL